MFSLKQQQTVFFDVKAVRYLLSALEPGSDHVASLRCLRTHGVGEIKDAANNRLVQPLGNAVCVRVLQTKLEPQRHSFVAGLRPVSFS